MFIIIKMKETQKRIKLYDNTKIIATDKALNVYIFDLAKDKKVESKKLVSNFIFFPFKETD